MTIASESYSELLTENASLRMRLDEAEDTLRAIGSGQVDAFVFSGPDGEQVFTLKGAEQPYRVLVETMNEGACILAPDGAIIYGNNRMATMLQVPLERLIGTQFSSYVVFADQPLVTAQLERSAMVNAPIETAMINGEGYSVPVLISCRVLDLYGGRQISMIVTDLTEQKRTEEIVASERLTRSIIEQAGEAIVVCDGTGEIIQASGLAHQHCGKNPLLKQFNDLFQLRIIETGDLFSVMAPLGGKSFDSVEVEFTKSEDQTLYFLLNATSLTNIHNHIIGCVVTLTDITGRKQAEKEQTKYERQLSQARKIESLSRMAGAIAHHFNNQLGVVMGNLELALADLPPESAAQTSISKSMKAAIQAAEISRLMLAYLGQTKVQQKFFDIGEAIRETLPFLGTFIEGTAIHLKTELPAQGPFILGDTVHIKQILNNLVNNAAEAVGAGQGEIALTLSTISKAEIEGLHFLPLDWEPKADNYVCLSVSDTGCGMDVAILEEVFDPFFSTKFTGRGLGLPVVLGLVRAHDGAITVESQPGKGTTVQVFFPVPTSALPSVAEEKPAVGALQKGGLALVVDDEPMVREMAQTMLERMCGYEVLAACDGYEAVEIFRAHKDEVVLVLLDLSMPGIDGWETLGRIRALRPDTQVIFASGYEEAQVMQGDHPEQPQAFLHKPYLLSDLKAVIEKTTRKELAQPQS